MSETWKNFLPLVEEAIANNKILRAPKELYTPINYTLNMGGKRIRPILVLMASELFGKPAKESIELALAVEVFHNFTLIHDDIMDEAPLRRGKETVHKKWGRDIAILSGDVMLIEAYKYLSKANHDKLGEMLNLFNQTAVEVCEGQQLDMNFENNSKVQLAEYLQMIRLKTAVLLATSLKLGALNANASVEDADLIYDFGQDIGIAFQIQDDYLDVFADEKDFGKQVGGDILNNKKTYLLLRAIKEASQEQKKEIENILSMKGSPNKIKNMIAIYKQLNVLELTQKAVQEYFNKAMLALDKINQSNKQKAPLIDLATQLLNRNY